MLDNSYHLSALVLSALVESVIGHGCDCVKVAYVMVYGSEG